MPNSESLKAVFISNLGFFKRYNSKNIYGLTGTLGSFPEKNFIKASYNLDSFIMPRFIK